MDDEDPAEVRGAELAVLADVEVIELDDDDGARTTSEELEEPQATRTPAETTTTVKAGPRRRSAVGLGNMT